MSGVSVASSGRVQTMRVSACGECGAEARPETPEADCVLRPPEVRISLGSYGNYISL